MISIWAEEEKDGDDDEKSVHTLNSSQNCLYPNEYQQPCLFVHFTSRNDIFECYKFVGIDLFLVTVITASSHFSIWTATHDSFF